MQQQAKIKNIILCGYRGTGKSTVSAIVAEKLGWSLIEMDNEIEADQGKTFQEITESGKNWLNFRKIEQRLLEKFLLLENVVISAGGGVGVNNIINPETGKTFGEHNRVAIDNSMQTLVVLLAAEKKSLAERIMTKEKEKLGTRPILDEDLAKKVELSMQKLPPKEQKEYYLLSLLGDAMQVYNQREGLYAKLTKNIINTSLHNPEQAANKIIELLKDAKD